MQQNLHTVSRSINSQAAQIRNSLSEIEKSCLVSYVFSSPFLLFFLFSSQTYLQISQIKQIILQSYYVNKIFSAFFLASYFIFM